ncbi:MAG: HD domain-containing protein [Candidatus Omnitrophota bacterium]|nr:HD domain-containing protein [Candidatus Omnitrophota bacterium]
MIPLHEMKKNPFFGVILKLAELNRRKVYLVGGYLRDLFLKRKSFDFDFAVDKGAIKFSRSIAERLKGDFVVLDKEHGSARVIVKKENTSYTLDFTDFRGRDINEDLSLRDFTINAMALDLSCLKNAASEEFIDPYSGKSDIKKGLIKVINNRAFCDDPLRILRVFSLSAVLKFKIDGETLKLAQENKDGIFSVSSERIREELFKILAVPNAADFFKKMDSLSILEKIIPEVNIMRDIQQGPYHHLDVLEHSFEAMSQIEKLFSELKRNKKVSVYLDEIIAAEHSRRQVLKLAVFLHDIGKPDAITFEEGKTKFHGHEHIGRRLASAVCDRLKLSGKEKDAIKAMILWHLRPGYLADNPDISERAIFRYFRDTDSEGVSILLLSMADQRSTRGPLTVKASRIRHEKTCLWLIKEYFRRKEEKKLPKIITGDDLMEKLKLVPGPVFGKILDKVEEEQAAGEITTKKEALELARQIAAGHVKKIVKT